MDFNKITKKAEEIRKLYAESDKKRLGKEWMRDALAKVYLFDGIDAVRNGDLMKKNWRN